LSAASDWKSKPEHEEKLEGVVEGEPIDSINSAFKHREKCEHDPIREPLSVVSLADREQCFQGVVAWNDESGDVRKKLTSDVEEDEEEVECAQSEKGVNLGNRSLLLKVVQAWVLGKLLIKVSDVALGFVLEGRHDEWCICTGAISLQKKRVLGERACSC